MSKLVPNLESHSQENWPPDYTASQPQRYFDNHRRYTARDGQVRIADDVRGFVEGTPGNKGDMSRYFFFCLIFDQIVKEGLKGDLAELGVYKGNTAALLTTYARRLGKAAYLLDTFEGFVDEDLKGMDANKKMEFGDTSLEAVRLLVGEDNARYIKGYFPGSASQIPDHSMFCLVHLDCDLYAPMKAGLEYFYTRLVPGGFIIMHDYSSLHWDGAERAVDEFFADKVESPIPMPDGAGSVVIRKAKEVVNGLDWLTQRRRSAVVGNWAKMSHGAPGTEFLGEGWSSPESWGVWGIGESHTLRLYVSADEHRDLLLDVDCHAVLLKQRSKQRVDVYVGGRALASWEFTLERNNGARTVRIPAELVTVCVAKQGDPIVSVEFCPQSVASPVELSPEQTDTRQLGLGISSIRMKLVEKA